MKEPGDARTQVVLVRHGETEWNRVERFRGRIDIDLNERGQRQARAAARRLSGWQIKAVYSSPLKRALLTAQPIAEAYGLDVTVLEGINDVDYGAWAGLSPEEAADRHATLFETWVHDPLRMEFPQGESIKQVRDRAWAAFEAVCAAHAGESIILVSHVVVNRVLICAALGLVKDSFWSIGQDNAAFSVLESGGGKYRLQLLNDTCHLHSLDGVGD